MDLRKRIVADPNILMGKPAVRGTRISVSFILSLIAGGTGESEIVKRYPTLTVEDVRACCLYASENLPGRIPPWQFEDSFLDSDEWKLVEGDTEPTLKSLFENG